MQVVTKAFKSKTLIFGYLLLFASGLQSALPEWLPAIPVEWQPIATATIGLVVVVLRTLTTRPLSEK